MAKLGADVDGPLELRFVATLGGGDGAVWQKTWEKKSAYASPDGSVIAFGSHEPLSGQATAGTEQLFVYDAGSDTLACASCPSDGSLPAGERQPAADRFLNRARVRLPLAAQVRRAALGEQPRSGLLPHPDLAGGGRSEQHRRRL